MREQGIPLEKWLPPNKEPHRLSIFYDLVCITPVTDESDKFAHWRMIRRADKTHLADLWRQICDSPDRSSMCQQVNWTKILRKRAGGKITFQCMLVGGGVKVRFVQGEILFNENCL